MIGRLQLIVRTPREVAVDEPVDAARVPTETGQVGLRPRQEPLALVVEPGLIVYRVGAAPRFAATAGGLLAGDRERAVLFTPFAVAGANDAEVLDALDRAMAVPDSDIAARRRLGELQERILGELSYRRPVHRAGGRRV